MVSTSTIQKQRQIIRRKIALLKENNEMTDQIRFALSRGAHKASSKRWAAIVAVDIKLRDDWFQVEEMIQVLEKQLKECY